MITASPVPAARVSKRGKIDAAATVFHIRLTVTLYCGLSREELAHLAGVSQRITAGTIKRGRSPGDSQAALSRAPVG